MKIKIQVTYLDVFQSVVVKLEGILQVPASVHSATKKAKYVLPTS